MGRIVSPALVAAFAVGLYAQTLGFGQVNLDDPWLIADNALLQQPSIGGLKRIFFDLSPTTRLQLGAEYLPVRDLSVMLDFALFGRWWGGFHLTNVLIYAVLCVLLLLALRRWLGRAELALIAALLYLTHPLHVESVAWLSERKGLLAAALAVGCCLIFRRFAAGGRLASWLATALLLVCAIWSKGLAVATVGLLAALLWLFPPPGSTWRRAWFGWAALAAVALLACVPLWITGGRMAMVSDYHGGGFAATAALAAEAHALYLKHALLLGEMGLAYPVDAEAPNAARAVVGALATGGLLGLAAVAIWRRDRWSTVGLAALTWLVFLLPVSQVVLPLQNPIADRYALLPTVGWALALAALLGRLQRPHWRWPLVCAVVLVQAGLTLIQTRSWAGDRALYRQALRAHPGNTAAMIQLARLETDPRRAAGWIERAAHLRPEDPRVRMHRGLLLARQGELSGAIAELDRAAAAPDADKVRANLALLLLRAGRGDEALRRARQAVRIRPLAHHNQHTLAVVALQTGRLEEAEQALARARALRPGHAGTYYNIAVLALRRGRREQARQALRQALRLQPDHLPARALQARLRSE